MPVSIAQWFCSVSRLFERYPPILPVSESILILTFDRCDLVLQDRPTTNIFISIVFEHPFTEKMISQETIMDPL